MTDPKTDAAAETEFDFVIIGSGFGGSVSALRLAQKGYKVAVLESGKRWRSSDFPATNWKINRFLWMPGIFCYGIQRLNLLKHVLILSGSGVGGGSLVYANTLYRPLDKFYSHPGVAAVGTKASLAPYYGLAEKMLGVTTNPHEWEVDHLMQETAQDMGFGSSYRVTPVGVYFNQDDSQSDPYFGGEGPLRTGCNHCGGCMVGCRFDSKNTLDKNYLHFAEKLGVQIFPENRVIDIIPEGQNGEHGYQIISNSPTGWFGGKQKTWRAKSIVLSAGVLGTVGLLLRLKEQGRLPGLSDRLGDVVRTNSESIVGVTSTEKQHNFSKGVAITSSVHPDEHTHIEPVRYSEGSDAMDLLTTLMTDGGGSLPRPLRFLINICFHPVQFLRTLLPFGFARRSIILLVMQTLDNSMRLVRQRRWIFPFKKTLSSAEGSGSDKIPTFIPVANQFARLLATKIKGTPKSAYNEVLLDVPTTAHILGGACFGKSRAEGVIDPQGRVFGYENMWICDGSMIPANPGVNPSLSITAFSEHTMAQVPPRASGEAAHFQFEKKWKVTRILNVVARQKLTGPRVGKKKTAGATKKAAQRAVKKRTRKAAT
ncbi:MAG: GMC family oxidoreductase [Leptospiraceae bacterium]|nr:GMC family oxidoreductase [Leptospiraceae bacterium]